HFDFKYTDYNDIYNLSLHDALPIWKILIESFIESLAVPPSKLTITNRTIEKALAIKNSLPDIKVVATNEDVVKGSDLIFICVKRSEEHTSELQSRENIVCRLLLEKK